MHDRLFSSMEVVDLLGRRVSTEASSEVEVDETSRSGSRNFPSHEASGRTQMFVIINQGFSNFIAVRVDKRSAIAILEVKLPIIVFQHEEVRTTLRWQTNWTPERPTLCHCGSTRMSQRTRRRVIDW